MRERTEVKNTEGSFKKTRTGGCSMHENLV
jgi:hypothetical protein